jgi:hypothetical protein
MENRPKKTDKDDKNRQIHTKRERERKQKIKDTNTYTNRMKTRHKQKERKDRRQKQKQKKIVHLKSLTGFCILRGFCASRHWRIDRVSSPEKIGQ